jgi:hypothetical protein
MPLVGSAGDAFAWCTGVDAARALGNGSQCEQPSSLTPSASPQRFYPYVWAKPPYRYQSIAHLEQFRPAQASGKSRIGKRESLAFSLAVAPLARLRPIARRTDGPVRAIVSSLFRFTLVTHGSSRRNGSRSPAKALLLQFHFIVEVSVV